MNTHLFLFLLLTSVSYSQDTTVIDEPIAITTETFHPNGINKVQKYFDQAEWSKSGKYILTGYIEYYNNGQLRVRANFKDSELHGPLEAYWKNGNLKRKDLYNNGVLVEGKVWDQKENEIEYFEFEIPSKIFEN